MTAITAFLKAMVARGIRPVDDIAGALAKGDLIRFRADGDRPGRLNAWAILHLDDRAAGAFGHYRLGISEKWRADQDKPLSLTERRELARKAAEAQERRERERQLDWQKAAELAQHLWRAANPANLAHPYLQRKHMAGHGLRQFRNRLLVPMRDGAGRLWNLQRIAPDGDKRFLWRGRTAGLYWSIGQPADVICIGEGAATVAAINRCTGHAAAAAFSAANLEAVARVLAQKFPAVALVICADDDTHLETNNGLEKARCAARAIGARIAVPGGGNGF